MELHRLTFDLEGASWTEVHSGMTRLVAIRRARAMLELLVAETAPKLAMVAINDTAGDPPYGRWAYRHDEDPEVVWQQP